ncbi:MAG: hypothetical protein WC180_02895 [Candidatus Paceibacterota bacterium]
MIKNRAKNITDKNIEDIVGILDGWKGKLSWKLLIDAIYQRFQLKYTRQTLNKHERIKTAFRLRKNSLRDELGEDGCRQVLTQAEGQMYKDRCSRLEVENTRLKEENRQLLEQYVVWAYNARTRGCDLDCLSRPLPRVDRDQTE